MADRVGKTFVVTGGASGLGKATVELLFAQGANVAILDRDVEKGKALSSDLGPRAAFFEMDATKEETIKVAIDSAYEKFGRLDGAICCAGVGAAATTINRKGVHASGIFDFVLKVNVYGVFNTCKYTAEKMAKNEPDANGLRGILINCSSVAGFEGQKGQVAYGASKGALNSMTLPMARDLGTYGIRVLTICPGIMDTPLMAASSEKVKASLEASVITPKRFGRPEEFAQLCAMLIDNVYMNGEVIRLDGGIRMGYASKL